MSGPYDDIIGLPHPISQRHPRMKDRDRAAQFAPFAALTGFDGAIAETARLTESEILPDESALEELDRRQQLLREKLPLRPLVEVTCFVPDGKKQGGAYRTLRGNLKKLDEENRLLIFADGTVIPAERIIDLREV